MSKKLEVTEVPDWRFEQQIESLVNILHDVHSSRPLMSVGDILKMLADIR